MESKLAWCYDCQKMARCPPLPGGETKHGEKYIIYEFRCPECRHILMTEKIPLPKGDEA